MKLRHSLPFTGEVTEMLRIDVEANPRQTDIIEDMTREGRLEKEQITNHNQNYVPL